MRNWAARGVVRKRGGDSGKGKECQDKYIIMSVLETIPFNDPR